MPPTHLLSWVPVPIGTLIITLSYDVLKTLQHRHHSSAENIPSGDWWISGCNYSSKVTTFSREKKKNLENQEALPVLRATLIRTEALLTSLWWKKLKTIQLQTS